MDVSELDLPQFAQDRHRLVRLCARLTGDPGAAEDLAQETLAEAWRLRQRVDGASADFPWLAAIARNLCLRWLRRRGRERARVQFSSVGIDEDGGGALEQVADPGDFTVELERHELADLLDRALALLPPATAQILVERYVRESPHAEVAARLGISPDAVAMRLARGRLQLRRLLDNELRDQAAAFGLGGASHTGWRETRVWCPRCGRRRLHGRFDRPCGLLAFRCPECSPAPDDLLTAYRLDNPAFARLLAGVSAFKPAYARTLAWIHDYYRRGLAAGMVCCTNCGRPTPLLRAPDVSGEPQLSPWPRLTVRCSSCDEPGSTSLGGLVHALPEIRRFWRAHPRMRIEPPREVEAAGLPALVVRVASVTGGEYLDVICARDTYTVLAIHGTGATPDRRDIPA